MFPILKLKRNSAWFLKIKVLRNQRLFQTLEKFQVLQTWIFFQVYSTNPASEWRPDKKSRFAEPEIFLGFERDFDFSRPRFSEIRVQIKRPNLEDILNFSHQNLNFQAHIKGSYV